MPEYVVQGGAVGIAGFAVYCMWKMSSNHSKHLMKYIQENTKALTGLESAIRELKNYLCKKV